MSGNGATTRPMTQSSGGSSSSSQSSPSLSPASPLTPAPWLIIKHRESSSQSRSWSDESETDEERWEEEEHDHPKPNPDLDEKETAKGGVCRSCIRSFRFSPHSSPKRLKNDHSQPKQLTTGVKREIRDILTLQHIYNRKWNSCDGNLPACRKGKKVPRAERISNSHAPR